MNRIINFMDELFPNPKSELKYNKDYEFLMAVILSAQCTDKRVNQVTQILFQKYDLYSLAKADKKDIENIIRSCGTWDKKSAFLIEVANKLINDCKGKVPNDFDYLIKLPGVGRKTANVVLGELYNVPSIAVDTHVKRVSNRLALSDSQDVDIVEKDLENIFPENRWVDLHKQFVLFGRYYCKAKKPECNKCKLVDVCQYENKSL